MTKKSYGKFKENGWMTNKKFSTAIKCEHELDEMPAIYIEQSVALVIRKLCSEIKSEWQMMLTGERDGSCAFITGYYIPKQEVTAGAVYNDEYITKEIIDEKSIVATIHSHSDMGVFFSVTDQEKTMNSPIRFHIVTNNSHEYKAALREDLPCGRVKFFEADVIFGSPDEDVQVEGIEKISKRKESYYDYAKGRYGDDYYDNFYSRKQKKHSTYAKCPTSKDKEFDDELAMRERLSEVDYKKRKHALDLSSAKDLMEFDDDPTGGLWRNGNDIR